MPLVRIVFSPTQRQRPRVELGGAAFTTKGWSLGRSGRQRLTGQRTTRGRRTGRRTLTAGGTGQVGEHSTGHRSSNRPEGNDWRASRNGRWQGSARARRNRCTGGYWRTGGHWGAGSYPRTGHVGEGGTPSCARPRAARRPP